MKVELIPNSQCLSDQLCSTYLTFLPDECLMPLVDKGEDCCTIC
jgi:hypothetical protein